MPVKITTYMVIIILCMYSRTFELVKILMNKFKWWSFIERLSSFGGLNGL